MTEDLPGISSQHSSIDSQEIVQSAEPNDQNNITHNSPANNGQVNGQNNANQYHMNRWSIFKAFFIRIILMYFISSFFRQKKPLDLANNQTNMIHDHGPATNLFSSGDLLDLYVYTSEQKNFTLNKSQAPLWVKRALKYGDWTSGPNHDGSFVFETNITASPRLMNNGSLYLHVYFVKAGFYPRSDAGDELYSKKYTIHKWKKLTKQRRIRLKRTVNLLTGDSEGPKEHQHNASIHGDVKFLPSTSHWHPNLTINLVEDYTPWTKGAIPAPLDEFIEFYEPTNQYYPIIYMNDYWNLNDDYQPINQTTPVLFLTLKFEPISLFKWQMYAYQSMRKQWYSSFLTSAMTNTNESTSSFKNTLLETIKSSPDWLDEDGISILTEEEEREQDQLKRIMLETNVYLLAVTALVSIVHMLFEMLAFKNEIQFWNSRTTLAGLSVQSVIFNVFQSVIVFLYVLDNDTSYIIRVSVVISTFIEAWKLFKVLKFKVVWPENRRQLAQAGNEPISRIPEFLPRLEWAYEETYVESDTKVYDELAFKYLGRLFFPLLACYCAYSLVYEEHRGWYSWVLSMLYGFLLTFGFITMTPQLFINYKLKSVAHLPWRMLTYKALNTFIDDLFAFVIKAPTLYRLGCLRDDVIFFIYLYQRWIYPIDPTRLNEFGVSAIMLDNNVKKLENSEVSNNDVNTIQSDQIDEDQTVRQRQLESEK